VINSRFLLDTKLGNPTRMSLQKITSYWTHWVSKDKKKDPFSFISFVGDSQGDDDESNRGEDDDSNKSKVDDDSNTGTDSHGSNKSGDEEEVEKSLPPDHYSIDDGLIYPFMCAPNERTNCLQELVPKTSQTNKTFHALVEMVDALEVSSISNI
jgi:hypothetical protein